MVILDRIEMVASAKMGDLDHCYPGVALGDCWSSLRVQCRLEGESGN